MTQLLLRHVWAFLAVLASPSSAQTPASSSTVVLENDRVRIERVQLAPGSRSDQRSIPQDSLAIALDAGTLEVSASGEPASIVQVQPANTWWWRRAPATHSMANVGPRPFTFLQVRLKARDATAAGDSEALGRPAVVPGIATLLDNSRVFVEKLTLHAGFRTDPPGQSHPEYVPRDVIIVALTPGEYEVSSTGEPAESGRFQRGSVWWWPKPPATHSVANAGTEPHDIVKISLK